MSNTVWSNLSCALHCPGPSSGQLPSFQLQSNYKHTVCVFGGNKPVFSKQVHSVQSRTHDQETRSMSLPKDYKKSYYSIKIFQYILQRCPQFYKRWHPTAALNCSSLKTFPGVPRVMLFKSSNSVWLFNFIFCTRENKQKMNLPSGKICWKLSQLAFLVSSPVLPPSLLFLSLSLPSFPLPLPSRLYLYNVEPWEEKECILVWCCSLMTNVRRLRRWKRDNFV